MNNGRNEDFICPCCQQVTFFPPSVLIMQGNYGAEHDTERATIKLCGSCYDRLYAVICDALLPGTIETEFIL